MKSSIAECVWVGLVVDARGTVPVSVLQASPKRDAVASPGRTVACPAGMVSAIAIQTICLELTLWTKPFYNYLARV